MGFTGAANCDAPEAGRDLPNPYELKRAGRDWRRGVYDPSCSGRACIRLGRFNQILPC